MLEVSWPDGSSFTRPLRPGEMNSVVEVAYPEEGRGAVLPNDTQVSAEFLFSRSGVGSSLTAECQLKTVVLDRDDHCLRVSDLINTFGVNVEVSTC